MSLFPKIILNYKSPEAKGCDLTDKPALPTKNPGPMQTIKGLSPARLTSMDDLHEMTYSDFRAFLLCSKWRKLV